VGEGQDEGRSRSHESTYPLAPAAKAFLHHRNIGIPRFQEPLCCLRGAFLFRFPWYGLTLFYRTDLPYQRRHDPTAFTSRCGRLPGQGIEHAIGSVSFVDLLQVVMQNAAGRREGEDALEKLTGW
jgi:hypothetical protein